MYDAENRRFMAVDPVKGTVADPQTMVQYTYCGNNPIAYVDLLGLWYVQVGCNYYKLRIDDAYEVFLGDGFIKLRDILNIIEREGYSHNNLKDASKKASIWPWNKDQKYTIAADINVNSTGYSMNIEYLIKANSDTAFYYAAEKKAYISKSGSSDKSYFEAFYCNNGTNYVHFYHFMKALGLDKDFKLVKDLPMFQCSISIINVNRLRKNCL